MMPEHNELANQFAEKVDFLEAEVKRLLNTIENQAYKIRLLEGQVFVLMHCDATASGPTSSETTPPDG